MIGSYRPARAGGGGVVPLRFRSSCLCRGPAPERGEATTKTRGSGHGDLGGWWERKKPHASTLMSITYEAVLGVRYSMMWDGQGTCSLRGHQKRAEVTWNEVLMGTWESEKWWG